MKKALFLFFFCIAYSYANYAQKIMTLAGDGGHTVSGDGGLASSCEFQYPFKVCNDTAGNLYILDLLNSSIRKIDASTGIIDLVVGSEALIGNTGDGGLATDALLYEPDAVCTDVSGNIYIADAGNNRIRKVTASTGIITTIAGDTAGFAGDNGLATSALLRAPSSIAIDGSGNIYIADANNNRIRKITASSGIINTIAGTGAVGYFGDGGSATNAKLDTPLAVSVDHIGNVYISDFNNARIRKIIVSTGNIETIAGTGIPGYSGDGAPATNAKVWQPIDLSVDDSNNLYIADQAANVIRKISATTNVISTVAGNGTPGFSGDGESATSAELNYPSGVCTDPHGNIIYIADKINGRIRMVYPNSLAINNPLLSKVDFEIMPNPSNGKFKIQTNYTTSYDLLVYDAIGTIVYQTEANIGNNNFYVDLGFLNSGIYFVRLNSCDISTSHKLIIEK